MHFEQNVASGVFKCSPALFLTDLTKNYSQMPQEQLSKELVLVGSVSPRNIYRSNLTQIHRGYDCRIEVKKSFGLLKDQAR